MSTYIGNLGVTLYEPKGGLLCLQDDLECSPRFLFRAHLPKSSSETTLTFVRSPGACFKYEDILGQGREFSKSIINKLERSLRDQQGQPLSCSLRSLQSSTRQPTSGLPQLQKTLSSQFWIHPKLPKEPSCMPYVALLEAYDVPSEGQLQHGSCYGE
jgi:hypothetical protein